MGKIKKLEITVEHVVHNMVDNFDFVYGFDETTRLSNLEREISKIILDNLKEYQEEMSKWEYRKK